MSNNLIADLEEFTREMAKHDERQAIALKPTCPSIEILELRVKLIEEEVHETLDAMYELQERNAPWDYVHPFPPELMAKIADGIADSIVVLIGTALAYGIPLQKVWDEVHRSNMDKVTKPCGYCVEYNDAKNCANCKGTGRVPITPRKREDGKILKPEGWVGPDIKSIIEEAMK